MAKIGFSAGRKNAEKAKAETAVSTATVPVPAPETVERPVYSPQEYKNLDIAEYRGRFADETKGFSDKQLFDIVVGTDDDLSDEDWRSLFASAANPNVPDGDTLAQHAVELGEKASIIMGETSIRLATAREDWQGGPIYTLLALRSTYDEDVLDTFPIPGSDTGINPDRFSITTVKGDKKGTKKTTFYAQFTRGTPEGKKILERLDYLERAADKGAIKEGIPQDILDMTPDARDTHRSFLEGRLVTMTQAYKKAMELHIQFKAVNSYADNIAADPIWIDGKSPDDVDEPWQAEVVRTAEPIVLYTLPDPAKPGKPGLWEHFSIGAFLKLKPAKALEQGGGFKRLVDSGATKKPPPVPGQVADENKFTIKTVDRSLGVLVEFHRYLLEIQSQKDGADWGKLVQALTKKGNDEYVSSIVELKNILVDTCRDNKLDQRYIALKQSGSDLVSETKAPEKAAS